MKITYLGHSALLIEEGNFKGLVDPFISDNPLRKMPFLMGKEITHIFVTHGHGDHIGDTIKIAQQSGALVISNAEICTYLNKFNIKTHSLHIGGRRKFDFGTVKMTNAIHGSSISEDGNIIYAGNPGGFVIELNSKKVYHAGDTGLIYDMKLLEDENIDVAFLPIGGNYTMDIDDAVKATEFIKAKNVVPMHYDTFGLIVADPLEFLHKVKQSKVIILNIDESINID